jgi:hypothetical protein
MEEEEIINNDQQDNSSDDGDDQTDGISNEQLSSAFAISAGSTITKTQVHSNTNQSLSIPKESGATVSLSGETSKPGSKLNRGKYAFASSVKIDLPTKDEIKEIPWQTASKALKSSPRSDTAFKPIEPPKTPKAAVELTPREHLRNFPTTWSDANPDFTVMRDDEDVGEMPKSSSNPTATEEMASKIYNLTKPWKFLYPGQYWQVSGIPTFDPTEEFPANLVSGLLKFFNQCGLGITREVTEATLRDSACRYSMDNNSTVTFFFSLP